MVSTDTATRNAQLATVADAIGVPIPPETLDQSGMQFVRAQLLEYDGTALAHIAFLSPDGAPIALCVYPTTAGDGSPLERSVRHGVAVLSWSTSRYEAVLLGDTPHEAEGLIRVL